MKTVIVQFVGGLLDGARRSEQLPDHWQFLRLEKKVGNKVHVYSGEVNDDERAVVEFIGTESLDEAHEDRS